MRYYSRLAVTGIKNNKRTYVPYMIACTGMVMMYYIIKFLSDSSLLENMRGGSSCGLILGLGANVVAVFSVLFMFYTNSFIMKKRKKEFGLYNILGMSKKHLLRIVIIENIIVAIITIILGLVTGILLSKLAELGLVNVMNTDVSYSFSISGVAVRKTFIIFGLTFAALIINAFRQIIITKPINLLKSENVGEKPPKANWLFGLIGIAVIGYAYYMAVSITKPLEAMMTFFKAVLLVIVGSYILFIAGSVMICRILQKNKGFYYKKNHFVSVASMTYRMKRNGAGLASICILATMVLVMISSSACLFFGEEESLNKTYPRRYTIEAGNDDTAYLSDETADSYEQSVLNMLGEMGAEPEDVINFRYMFAIGLIEDGELEIDSDGNMGPKAINDGNIMGIYLVPERDYEKYYDVSLDLKPGEAMIYTKDYDYDWDYIKINDDVSIDVRGRLDDFMCMGELYTNIIPITVFVVPDYEEKAAAVMTNEKVRDADITGSWIYSFDAEKDLRDYSEDELFDNLRSCFALESTIGFADKEVYRDDFYGTFGGLFFIGIILSIVFIAATVLIIYYKQVSEGVEDREKFEIMKKVGMTKKEIRKSINSQMLIVFFLPVLVAVAHLCFAFPLIEKMLYLFNLNNRMLFVATSGITILVFAAIYTIVYKLTSNVYFNIVNSRER